MSAGEGGRVQRPGSVGTPPLSAMSTSRILGSCVECKHASLLLPELQFVNDFALCSLCFVASPACVRLAVVALEERKSLLNFVSSRNVSLLRKNHPKGRSRKENS